MRLEMRKLNRAKYACSEEDVDRLMAEGYTMVDTEPEPDGASQTADPTQGQNGADGAGQTADPAQGQSGADGTGQTADPAQGQSGADGTGQTADPAQGQNADADKQKEKRGARKK